MKNQEFLAQLSQFTTASGVEKLNGSFESLTAAMQSNQALQASSLVGRNVLIETERGYLPAQGNMSGAVEVPEATGNLRVNVYNKAGELVKTIELGQQSAGQAKFSWDGTDAAGNRVAAGEYRVAAESTFNDTTYSYTTLAQAPVESVTIGRNGQGMVLNVGALGAVSLDQVRQIL
jgi:flagellar basal-body rod modification protein FlgD